jgi:ribosomal protein L11 methyltransferase
MGFYKEFIITAEPFIPEIISSLLWELDLSGIDEEVNCIKAYSLPEAGLTDKNISDQLQKLVEQKMIFNFNVEEYILEDKNWNEEWEKSINVIEVSEKLIIKPTFREYKQKPGQIVITIDPKMSFGTGEHQTTKLVLRLLEKYVKPETKILDVGSGTAVLSIAALKLGAASALAIDNDDWCFANGKENCSLNNVSSKIDVRLGEIKDVLEKDFDIILANIQKNILIKIAGSIKEKLKKNGIVILSGLLFTDEEEIINVYSGLCFKLIESNSLDEWIALVFEKVE